MSRIPKRLQRYVLFLLGVLIFSISLLNLGLWPSDDSGSELDWVLELVYKHRPDLGHPLDKYPKGKAKEKMATDTDWIYSKAYLAECLDVTDEDIQHLKTKHTSFVDDLKADKHTSFGRNEGTDGIVFVGAGRYSWLALIAMEQLRLLGCTLPIEIFIGLENDYEPEFCERILPKYNARCSLLHEEIPNIKELLPGINIDGFQYKNLAFLISKFQNILFLDADNVPVSDPTPLFKSKVFREYGLITWPDAWARTTHPGYYEIVGLDIPDRAVRGPHRNTKVSNYRTDIHMHDLENAIPNPTTESGMILFNKKRHVKTLALSLYYNLFGPKLYYPLFTQGSAGEGDKETFVAAAHVLHNKYYQVQQPLMFIGHTIKGKFQAKSLGQFDPIEDYENSLKGTKYGDNNELVPAKGTKDPNVLFMHLSFPKLIPFALLNDDDIIKNGEHVRMYVQGGGAAYESMGRDIYVPHTVAEDYDFELRIFQIITSALCKDYVGETHITERLIGLKLGEYEAQNPDDFCPNLIAHTTWLNENPHWKELV